MVKAVHDVSQDDSSGQLLNGIVPVFIKEIKMDKLRFKGIMLAILGTTFWGVSGTIAEFLFKYNFYDKALSILKNCCDKDKFGEINYMNININILS